MTNIVAPADHLRTTFSGDAKSLIALAERVEQAQGPDRLLDAEIHALLFGVVDAAPVGLTYRDAFDHLRGRSDPYHFTGHVEGAEMALPGPEWPEYQITRRYCTGYHASVGIGRDGNGCDSAALALTAAALRAHAAMGAE